MADVLGWLFGQLIGSLFGSPKPRKTAMTLSRFLLGLFLAAGMLAALVLLLHFMTR
jgi:hypothetical protein